MDLMTTDSRKPSGLCPFYKGQRLYNRYGTLQGVVVRVLFNYMCRHYVAIASDDSWWTSGELKSDSIFIGSPPERILHGAGSWAGTDEQTWTGVD